MKLHANAPFGPKGRLTMVKRVIEQGWSLAEAAEAAGVSERTCSKRVGRYRAEGEAGLHDRSSAPCSVPGRTPEDRVTAIAALRRVRMTGPEIAECLGMAPSTVSAVLSRIGLGKLSRLEPPEPPNRYERAKPGELIHIDVKKLVRIERGAGHRLPEARARLLCRPRGRCRRGDDRQRLRLRLDCPRARLPGVGDPPYPHSPLPSAHQRQGRALHPHDARRLDLRSDLPRLKRANRSAIRLAGLL